MSDKCEERTYYLRTVCMYMDLTKDTLLKLFKYLIESDNIIQFLTSDETITKLLDLFKNGVLNKSEYNLVSSSLPHPEKIDIALLIRLIIGLCKNTIAEPQLGWKNKPQPKDVSLGADLIRLRDVRNKLIGHRADAKLPEAEYEKIWSKVQAVLVRVVKKIEPESKKEFLTKLEGYRHLEVDTERMKVEHYLDQLSEYQKDFEKLQNKIEEFNKKVQEFHVYFETTPERFVRYVKLLFDGGRLVLCGVLERELQKNDKDLKSLVFENQEILQTMIDREYQSDLFPSKPCKINHTVWDVDLLASVILLVFKDINTGDISNIEQIKCARASYAETAFSCLDADKFLLIWTDLTRSLNQLSMNIDERKKRQVDDVIDLYKKKSECVDADGYLDQLRERGVPVKTLKEIHTETVYQLRQLLMQLNERGIKFKTEHVVQLKILTTCHDEEKKKHAEDFLENYLDASLRKKALPNKFIGTETDKLLERITSHPHVTPTGIKRACIIMSFGSSTPGGLLHLLDYFEGQHFHDRIRNISNELYYLYEEAFLLLGYVTLESLSSIHTSVCVAGSKENKAEHDLSLPLKCTSVEGLRHVLTTLRNDKTTNILNSIADKISAELRETVTITVFPDLLSFRDVFEKTDSEKKGPLGAYEDEAVGRYSEKEKKTRSADTIRESTEQLLAPDLSPETTFVDEDDSVLLRDSEQKVPRGTYEDEVVGRYSEKEKKNRSAYTIRESSEQLLAQGLSPETTFVDEDDSVLLRGHSIISKKEVKKRSVEPILQDTVRRRHHLVDAFREFESDQSDVSVDDEMVQHGYCHHMFIPIPHEHCDHQLPSIKSEGDDHGTFLFELPSRRYNESQETKYEITQRLTTLTPEDPFVASFAEVKRHFREMVKGASKVTEGKLKALQADIEGIFTDLQSKETGAESERSGHLKHVYQTQQRQGKENKRRRLKRLRRFRKEFTTFKRGQMKKLVSNDKSYKAKTQEFRDFLIRIYMDKFKERVHHGESVYCGVPKLYSKVRGNIQTYRDVFYATSRKCKNICVIGEERMATSFCLNLVTDWCDKNIPCEGHPTHLLNGAESKRYLDEFEFILMISIKDVGKEICIPNMVKKCLLRGEYEDIFEKVIERESDKVLILLDGLSQWDAKRHMKMPIRNFMDDYVVLTTKRQRERIEDTDHVLYLK